MARLTTIFRINIPPQRGPKNC